HALAVRASVDDVAQRDHGVARVRPDGVEQRGQGPRAAVDVPDGDGPAGHGGFLPGPGRSGGEWPRWLFARAAWPYGRAAWRVFGGVIPSGGGGRRAPPRPPVHGFPITRSPHERPAPAIGPGSARPDARSL